MGSRPESSLVLPSIGLRAQLTISILIFGGPAPVPLKGGARYLLTFIDDFSRKVWIYFLNQKNDVFPTFKKLKALIENQTGKKIKRLRMDNGMKFYGSQFNKFYENKGIVRHRTV